MKRHSLDLTSLVFALVFLMYASLWPLWQLEILDRDNFSWVPATALILIGLLGVTLSIMRSRPERADPTESEDTFDETRKLFDDDPTAVVNDSRQ